MTRFRSYGMTLSLRFLLLFSSLAPTAQLLFVSSKTDLILCKVNTINITSNTRKSPSFIPQIRFPFCTDRDYHLTAASVVQQQSSNLSKESQYFRIEQRQAMHDTEKCIVSIGKKRQTNTVSN